MVSWFSPRKTVMQSFEFAIATLEQQLVVLEDSLFDAACEFCNEGIAVVVGVAQVSDFTFRWQGSFHHYLVDVGVFRFKGLGDGLDGVLEHIDY